VYDYFERIMVGAFLASADYACANILLRKRKPLIFAICWRTQRKAAESRIQAPSGAVVFITLLSLFIICEDEQRPAPPDSQQLLADHS
jgi:hypothetical protein